ncbi:monovalent cation/H(+) antiporter subunit G [Streptomyces sp. SL13]|uniref:Monovalent cation/H(+) antiporter subunit G n=1 Tax=Streptantibioticus silvisoli TaxID=2705255 RepID=A0AA90K7S0_9ACTN|nr:monovalent cation/H(+) antiporter subunit G [Streptantibioticus silvisoli]MDI5969208.1 monovalent cation/H(+) antiporter subunit G [Streptantibioticus silvisoli]
MTIRHLVALVLLTAGTAVVLLSALALVVLPRPYGRLHALSPASSLGAPLIALALAVQTGPGRAAVKLLAIAVVLAVGGPVTTMALGRATAQHENTDRAPGPAPDPEGKQPQ